LCVAPVVAEQRLFFLLLLGAPAAVP